MSNPRGDKRAEAKDLRERLNTTMISIAEEVCEHLLPGGTRIGNEWRVGSVKGEAGRSLAVTVDGEKKVGLWKDFATDEPGGDLVALWIKVRKLSFRKAAEEMKQWISARAEAFATAQEPRDQATPTAITHAEWQQCVADADGEFLDQICEWRRYS